MPIRRTCRTHASWQIAISLAVLMLMLAIAVASAHYQPSLSDPQVSPRETTAGDPINFSVDFTDETGAAPRSVQVQIDDSVRAMAAASGDYRHGVRFSLSIPVPVGWHAISFIAIPAHGDREFEPAGAVTVHPASVTPSPSQPKPTQSPSSIGPTQAPAAQSAEPTSETASGRDGSPAPESSPKADPSAGLTGMTPVGPVTTPTHPAATPAARGSTSSQGAAANGEPAGGDQPSSGTGDVPENGSGQSVDGAEGSTGFGGTSGHGPGLIEAARGGSGTGNTAGVPSYLLVNYHAPLSQLIVALAPSISTAAGGSAAWAAFVLFGKRRRDGAAADPESKLATAAATGLEIGAGQGLTTVDESLMPRWRRPSLQQARRTDPLRAVVEASSLSFAASGLQTGEDYERRQIRYRLVRLLDRPDELRSAEIGVLDRGDEVLLLERRGVYWLVLCPDGRQGWVHRMTLSDPAREDAPEVVPWEDPAMADYASTDYVPAESVPEGASAPDSEPADPGFLEAYMQARNDGLRSTAATQAEPPAESAVEAVASGLQAAEPSVASRVPAAGPSTDAAPAGEPGCAGERCSGRKSAGTHKAATGSRPGAKSRRP